MPKNRDEEMELPPFVDGVLRVFEGLAKSRVAFLWIEGVPEDNCMFCTRLTDVRLQGKVEGHIRSVCICSECRELISEAPTV